MSIYNYLKLNGVQLGHSTIKKKFEFVALQGI